MPKNSPQRPVNGRHGSTSVEKVLCDVCGKMKKII